VQIKRVHIKNFKSIVDLSLDLAPINVFIGENGSGKSNILEALAFAAAAAANKLDNEFLVSRGIRVTDARLMRSAFLDAIKDTISLDVEDERGIQVAFELTTSGNISYPRWESRTLIGLPPHTKPARNPAFIWLKSKVVEDFINEMSKYTTKDRSAINEKEILAINEILENRLRQWNLDLPAFHKAETIPLEDFIVYSPEASALRTFEKEGQILPLGVRGEGLLKLLRVLAREDKNGWSTLQHNLGLLDWLQGVEIDHDTTLPEQSIQLRDRFVAETQPAFDQRSANEGFLYLLFFFALILSKATPRFFAIENVDTSLNPKACSELMRRITSLAVERQKQILLTTHNPSLLDGLNLHDDNQRLFVVYRNRDGHTTARRIKPPQPVGDEPPIKLSEAFVRGLLGGIPQNF